MTPSNILLTLQPPPPHSLPGGLPLAGLRLGANQALPGLPTLRPGPVEPFEPVGLSPDPALDPGASLPGLPLHTVLGDLPTELSGFASPHGITVRATGFGEVFVSASGHHLAWRPGDDTARQRPELILGPGLLLALALQGTFCLHASAVLAPHGAVLFAGESGAGKSTLAARLSAHHGFQRLTDDLTPFRAEGSGCHVLPHFPQLKLPPESQHPDDAPEAWPVARLYLLEECDVEASVREEPVSPAVAALSVCRQAVASRLFPEALTTSLLQAGTALVENVQVRRLLYPKRPGSIADVARLVSES